MFLPDPLIILELGLMGIGIGFIAGLLGIGGGMLMVPFLMYVLSQLGTPEDITLKMAIATAMSTIVFTSISSVRAHHKMQAVRWDLVKGLAPGIILGSLISSVGVFSFLKGSTLAYFFEAFVFFSATQLFINKKPRPSRQMPGSAGMMLAGSSIGFMSGLVGAGGGFISVPFMVWCNISIRNAVATSAALGFPIALANALGYVASGSVFQGRPDGSLGFIWIPGVILIAMCSVLTAPLGVRVAHTLPVKLFSRIFAFFLYALSIYMFYQTLTKV